MTQEYKTSFQGNQITKVPTESGLYAWYYKPLVVDEGNIAKTLSSFLQDSPKAVAQIEMRYGLRLVSEFFLKPEFGSQRQSPPDLIEQVINESSSFLVDFFKSSETQHFSRPIYIGIAKNLNDRVYKQHYTSLIEMYDMRSPVYRHLSLNPNSTVQEVMDKLNIPHTFALEARVRNIAPRDLAVNIFVTNSLPKDIGSDIDAPELETPARRALERLLQLVADPICGRR
ncbi:MAG: hypothetical protein VKI82_08920 [Leptolyngbya sp.]|nr:hypothetical protein [Leptolyngbya sp.]